MSKKEHTEFAKTLYIVHGMSLRDIASKLGISERTLQNWKTAGGWEAEKSRIAEAEGMTHESLYRELTLLLRSIRQDREANKEIDVDRYKQLESLAKTMQNTFNYERNAPKKNGQKKSNEEVLKEAKKVLWGED